MLNASDFDKNLSAYCGQFKVIGYYMSTLSITGILSNMVVLSAYFKSKSLRTPVNTFVISLLMVNLLASITEAPIVAINAFSCRFIFGPIGCYIGGVIMYFTGTLNITVLVVMSIERYWVIYRPNDIRKITVKFSVIAILACIVYCLFWTLMPLFGIWSSYALEGEISCSVEWKERSASVTSYNIAIFIFVFVIPLIIMIFTNSKLVIMVKSSNKRLFNSEPSSRKMTIERKSVIMTVILIVAFIISWTPYALVAMYSAFADSNGIDTIGALLPSLLAKTSLVWPAFITIFMNKDVRKNLPFVSNNSVLPMSLVTTFNRTRMQLNTMIMIGHN